MSNSNPIVNDRRGEGNRERDIIGVDIANLFRNWPLPQKVVILLANTCSVSKHVKTLNSQNPHERFDIVIGQRRGHVCFAFEITGRRTHRVLDNVRCAIDQCRQTRIRSYIS